METPIVVAAAAVAAVMLVVLARSVYQRFGPAPAGTIPTLPDGWRHWLWGHSKAIQDTNESGRGALIWLEWLHKYGGSKMVAASFPGFRFVLVNDPEAARKVNAQREAFVEHEIIRDAFGAYSPTGLISVEGTLWQRHRRAVQRVFRPENLRAFWRSADTASQTLVQLLRSKAQSTVNIEVDRTCMALFLDVMGHALLSVDFHALEGVFTGRTAEPGADMDILEAAHHVMDGIGSCSIIPKFLWSWVLPKERMQSFREATQVMRARATAVLAARAAALREGHAPDVQDFVGIMLAAKAEAEAEAAAGAAAENKGEPVLTEQEIVDEIMVMIMGATETSAHTTSWLFWAMLRHVAGAPPLESFDNMFEDNMCLDDSAWRNPHGVPPMWQRIRDEVAAVIGMDVSAPITWEALEKLHYVEGAIKETLRLYNVTPNTSRQAVQQSELCGHAIRRGDIIVISNVAMHSDANNFPRPFAFLPERWHPDAGADIRQKCLGAFNAFGGGPKMCIGHKVAIIQMKVVLARLAQVVTTFHLSPEAPRVQYMGQITARPREGLHLTMALGE